MPLSYTRRHILRQSTALATMGVMPRPLLASLGGRHPEPLPPIEDPRLKELTSASLSAATAAGASYADVRLTHVFIRRFNDFPDEAESMSFYVRALVHGYWGFATSPLWSVDEAVRIAHAAVAQARANSMGKVRPADLAPVIPVSNGHWTMPVKQDPFTIARDEVDDLLQGLRHYAKSIAYVRVASSKAKFVRCEQAFASTEHHYHTQRTYESSGGMDFAFNHMGQAGGISLDCLSPAGVGFELFREQPLRQIMEDEYETALADATLPVVPVDVGRYPSVFDANAMAKALSVTIGEATQMDRAMGYEANAGGTSYITEPLEMIGTLKIGTDALTVTGNRTEPGGVATVQWDDDGATATDFTLVKDGVLVDMQTNREGAGMLKSHYEKTGQPFRSNGCSYSPEGMFAPLTHTANLSLQSASDTATFDSLIEGVEKGIAFKNAGFDMDFQQISGLVMGAAYEIRKGKRVSRIAGAGVLFRTPEFWTSIMHFGGVGSRKRFGLGSGKGEPYQESVHSVTAVPALFRELTIIDVNRKA